MPVISIYVSDEAMRRLEHYSRESERTVVDLAESAVESAAYDVRMPEAARDPLRNNPVVGFMSEKQAEGILAEMRANNE